MISFNSKACHLLLLLFCYLRPLVLSCYSFEPVSGEGGSPLVIMQGKEHQTGTQSLTGSTGYQLFHHLSLALAPAGEASGLTVPSRLSLWTSYQHPQAQFVHVTTG